jgi:tripartite-type tricarboxylate transporter receptor subunit TctC
MDVTRRTFMASTAGAALLGALPAFAQSYPTRAVRLIVPVGIGTTTDLVSRIVAQRLGEAWGQGVVVENLPGTSGILGLQQLAKSPPDGYTIGAVSSNFAINSALFTKLPYDPIRDFRPLLNLTSNYFVLVAHPSLPAKSVQELIALAKAKEGAVDYASTGNGGSPHLAVEMFAHMAGIKLTHIPYKATGPAVTDLLSGRVPLLFTSISTLLPHIRTGKLRALAVSGGKRVAQLPDVPTMVEAGVPGYDMRHWVGMVAPSGVPEPIVAKLQADMTKILRTPEVESQLNAQAVEVDLLGQDAFAKRISDEIALWTRVVKQSGARVE